MKNFTFKLLSGLFLAFLGTTTYAQEWNFSSATLSALGSVEETKTIEGLTIFATSAAAVVVDANNKFTFRYLLCENDEKQQHDSKTNHQVIVLINRKET